jgi:folylpolyglutamate synthase/dihydropteroate synthase
MCLKGDKELKLIAKALKNNFEKLIITGSKEMELMEAQELHFAISKFGLTDNIEMQNEPTKAFSDLINDVKRTDQPGVIIGSHYIANAVFDKFGIFM